MTRKQRIKNTLAWYGIRKRTEDERNDFERRNEQSFIDRFSNAMREEYGVGFKKPYRQQRKRELK